MSFRKPWTASALGRVTRMSLLIRHWLHCCLTRYVSMLHHHHASYPTLIYPYPSQTHILCSALVSLRVDVFTIQTSVASLPCRSVYRSATLSTAVQFHVFLHNAQCIFRKHLYMLHICKPCLLVAFEVTGHAQLLADVPAAGSLQTTVHRLQPQMPQLSFNADAKYKYSELNFV